MRERKGSRVAPLVTCWMVRPELSRGLGSSSLEGGGKLYLQAPGRRQARDPRVSARRWTAGRQAAGKTAPSEGEGAEAESRRPQVRLSGASGRSSWRRRWRVGSTGSRRPAKGMEQGLEV